MTFKVSMFTRNSGTEPVKVLLDKSLQENQSQNKSHIKIYDFYYKLAAFTNKT